MFRNEAQTVKRPRKSPPTPKHKPEQFVSDLCGSAYTLFWKFCRDTVEWKRKDTGRDHLRPEVQVKTSKGRPGHHAPSDDRRHRHSTHVSAVSFLLQTRSNTVLFSRADYLAVWTSKKRLFHLHYFVLFYLRINLILLKKDQDENLIVNRVNI